MKIYNLEDTDEADGSIQAESMDSVSLSQFLVSQTASCFVVFFIDFLNIFMFYPGRSKNAGFFTSRAVREERN